MGLSADENVQRKLISEERRNFINKQYWDIDYERQCDWLLSNVKEVPVKQVKVKVEDRKRDRSVSFEYFLMNSNRDLQQVCQKIFLRTLGYTNNKKIDYLFRNTAHNLIVTLPDQRGRHEPGNKTSDKVIKAIDLHILSANPTSHYRRKHAPLRLYLTSELNTTILYKYFMESNREMKYDLYRKRLNLMNISFARLGLEDCETCITHSQHIHRGIESKFANNGIDFVLGKLLNDVECSVNECELCSDHHAPCVGRRFKMQKIYHG